MRQETREQGFLNRLLEYLVDVSGVPFMSRTSDQFKRLTLCASRSVASFRSTYVAALLSR